jgi:hypothetical protein
MGWVAAGGPVTLGSAIVLPVHGPGFRDRFWVGFGCKPGGSGPKSGSKLPGPSARAVWDRFLVRSHQACGQNRPKTGPRNPVQGPEALLRNLSKVFKAIEFLAGARQI